jgi:hypothetical protein
MGKEGAPRNFLRKSSRKVSKKGLYNEINKSAVKKRRRKKEAKNNSNIVKTNPRNKVEKGTHLRMRLKTQ